MPVENKPKVFTPRRRGEITSAQKAEKMVVKAIAQLLTIAETAKTARVEGDLQADLRIIRDTAAKHVNTLLQDGDGKGKRYRGNTVSHDFADNANAFLDVAMSNNIQRLARQRAAQIQRTISLNGDIAP